MNEYDSDTTQPFGGDATDYVSNAFELDSVDSEVAEADSDDSEDTQIFDAPPEPDTPPKQRYGRWRAKMCLLRFEAELHRRQARAQQRSIATGVVWVDTAAVPAHTHHQHSFRTRFRLLSLVPRCLPISGVQRGQQPTLALETTRVPRPNRGDSYCAFDYILTPFLS